MAKITREPQKIFGGSLLAADNIAVFGSTKLGTPTYSLDPSVLQSTAFLSGWADALVNNKAPTMQELNGVFYVATYQLAYLMQAGVPEYDAAQVYYIGSVANDGSGNLYACIANDTTAVAVTDPTKWRPLLQSTVVAALPGTTSATCDCMTAKTFTCASTGNIEITVDHIQDGESVNILLSGAAARVVTWVLKKPDGNALAEKKGLTYSNTMTNGLSLFTLLRVGDNVIVNSLHGIA